MGLLKDFVYGPDLFDKKSKTKAPFAYPYSLCSTGEQDMPDLPPHPWKEAQLYRARKALNEEHLVTAMCVAAKALVVEEGYYLPEHAREPDAQMDWIAIPNAAQRDEAARIMLDAGEQLVERSERVGKALPVDSPKRAVLNKGLAVVRLAALEVAARPEADPAERLAGLGLWEKSAALMGEDAAQLRQVYSDDPARLLVRDGARLKSTLVDMAP